MSKDQDFCKCAIPWIETNNSCGRCQKAISPERVKQITDADAKAVKDAEDEEEATIDVGVNNRSATENRKVIEALINNLTYAKKYRKAIKGGQFATFTLMGTNDWEDYASLTLQSLQLLTLANIDDNLEKIRILLEEQKK
jgi:hypothetical protein